MFNLNALENEIQVGKITEKYTGEFVIKKYDTVTFKSGSTGIRYTFEDSLKTVSVNYVLRNAEGVVNEPAVKKLRLLANLVGNDKIDEFVGVYVELTFDVNEGGHPEIVSYGSVVSNYLK